jgi:hypothetical protein
MPRKKKQAGEGRRRGTGKQSGKEKDTAGESGSSKASDEDDVSTAAVNASKNKVVHKGGRSHTATGASSSKASAGPAQARAPAPDAGAGGQNPRSSGAGMRHDASDDELDTAGGGARKKQKSQSVAVRKRVPSLAAQAADDRSKRLQQLDEYGPPDFTGRLADAAADAKFRQATKQSVRKFMTGIVAPVRSKPGSLASRTMLLNTHMPYADDENTSDEDDGQQPGLVLSRRAVRFQVQYAHNMVAAWSRGLLMPTKRKLSDTIERAVSLALILYGAAKYTTTLDQHKASLHEPFLSDSHEKTQTPRSRWRRVFIAAAAATEDFGTPKVCMQRVMGTYWGVYIATCT